MPASNTVWICTLLRGRTRGTWSRYVFPWNIQHFAQLEDTLYMRHGDTVSYADVDTLDDNGVGFQGIIQWPWLDFGRPGVDKMMVGFDNVGDGTCSIEVGYNQDDTGYFTTPYAIPQDTVPGQIIGMPVNAPSLSVRLTYDEGQAWKWDTLQLYLMDMRTTA